MCTLAASTCREFNIPVENIKTHAELSPNRKIDINHIPYLKLHGIKTVGDYLRNRIDTYIHVLDTIR